MPSAISRLKKQLHHLFQTFERDDFSDDESNARSVRSFRRLAIAIFRWSPEDIFNEMHRSPIPNKLLGVKLLIEIGGVDMGWIIDCTDDQSDGAINITRYDVPPSSSTRAPSGPPSSEPSLQSLPWCWYQDRKTFSKIESGNLSDTLAYVTGKVAVSGDSSKFDYLEGLWLESKEKAEQRKLQRQLVSSYSGGRDIEISDDEIDDEDDVDEETRIIATFKPEVEPKDPRTKAFWIRHFGTDALVSSYLFLLSSIIYMGLMIYNLISQPINDASDLPHNIVVNNASDLAHKIARVCASFFFVLGSVYFIKLSYPETLMVLAYRVMTVDPDTMSFIERYFTANEMLIALWLFTGALIVPYSVVVLYELIKLKAYNDAFMDSIFVGIVTVASFILNVPAMPDFMRMNNGRGSSYFFDKVWVPLLCLQCGSDETKERRMTFWRKHLGTDTFVSVWFFAILGIFLGIESILFIIAKPESILAWMVFLCSIFYTIGSLLLVRASYPENMNTSIFHQIPEEFPQTFLATPLLS